MWKNQKGFSLVETIIVIALVAILAGSTIAMVGHIRYANTKKVAEEVDNALSRLRLDTISREWEERQYLYIYQLPNDGYYMKLLKEEVAPTVGPTDNLNGNGTRLCGNNVKFYKEGETDPIDGQKVICVSYKKNGVFRLEEKEGDIVKTRGTNTGSITISGTGTYTICLDDETGRHYFE